MRWNGKLSWPESTTFSLTGEVFDPEATKEESIEKETWKINSEAFGFFSSTHASHPRIVMFQTSQ